MSSSTPPIPPTPAPPAPARAPAPAQRATLPTASISPPRLTARAGWGMLLVLALLLVGWWGTLGDMWLRWFPAWERMADQPLMERLTKGDSYYSHGPLVLLTSLALCYFIYRRVGLPARRTKWGTAAGWVVLAASLLLHLMSVYARVMFVSGFSLLGVLTGLALIAGGGALLLAYWLQIAVFIFMVPLPEVTIGALNFALKGVASDAAVWLTNNVFGVPAVKNGSYVYLAPAAPDLPPKMLVVENVCAGLRSLISLTFFAALFAMVCRVRGVWRGVMLAMAVPLAVLCNIVRITALNLVANAYGVEAASEEGWFHGFSGMAVFVVALGLLFALEQGIIALGKWWGRPWMDARLLGYLERVPTGGGAVRGAGPAVVAVLALAAGLSLWWQRPTDRVHRGDIAAHALPQEVTIGGLSFAGTDQELDAQTLSILETDDYLCRYYTNPQRLPVQLLIVFSPDNRKGTHPPDVCLEGSGEKTLTKDVQVVTLADGRKMALEELITQRGVRLSYHVFLYKCGDRYTTSFFRQQATIFLNGLLAHNASGALIHWTLPVNGQDVETARAQALAAAAAMLPTIDRQLP